MTEKELWQANLRAIDKRVVKHKVDLRRAMEDYNLALAYIRDATLTPLEAACAGMALEECHTQ